MEPFVTVTGVVAPLDRQDVDTDQIIPQRFLRKIARTGFGPDLFANLRYLGDDHTPNPDFVLNQPRYEGAQVLLARANFGCGSSREHAPWALGEYGFKALIAPSFADIFFNNCFSNGILPIVLAAGEVETLFQQTFANEGYRLTIDLPAQKVTAPDGTSYGFAVDPFKKECLLRGLDTIGWTLQFDPEIGAFEGRRREDAPWLIPAGAV
ncbi:MAG: 3-isopropylmalate dehydratase small subunit [Chloroflexota bacterium]